VPQQNVAKLLLSTKAATNTADTDLDKLTEYEKTDPASSREKRQVYAARLHGLLKSLATAEGAVQEGIKARTELIGALEKLLSANKASLEADSEQLKGLVSRRAIIDQRKRDVELAIMGDMNSGERDPSHGNGSMSPSVEPERPEVEALTPPSAHDEPDFPSNGEPTLGLPSIPNAEPAYHSPVVPQAAQFQPPHAPGIEILSDAASHYQAIPVTANGGVKRRRVDSGDDFPDLGNDGIDADVEESIRKDSMAW